MRRLISALILSLVPLAAAQAQSFNLRIIAFNDFHGNLQSPGEMRANADSPLIPVGGVDYLAAYVQHLKFGHPENVVVAAGDIIGASPLSAALFHDEDTIEAMNRLGLELTSVGNHEFDQGKRELLRKQNGGCSTLDKNTCEGAAVGTPVPFEGAKFQYLAANVIDTSTGKTLFPGYAIKTYHGVKIAFIGLVLHEAPTVILPSGVAGLRFTDEATAANAIVKKLRPQGVKIFVVLIHQGGAQTTKTAPDINACAGNLEGSPIRTIVGQLDNSIALVISAHTHAAYVCSIPNRSGRDIPVTSAASYGRLLTSIDMTIAPKSATVTSISANNILVDRSNPAIHPDAAIKGIVDRYTALAAPLVDRVLGSITAAITRKHTASGETTVGDVIGDAELSATSAPSSGGAVIAFMNSGGIRADLPFDSGIPGVAPGKVTYGEIFAIQPFGNTLTTLTLTGTQIKTMLEEQFKGCALGFPADQSAPPTSTRILQVSSGFTYTWNPGAPVCAKVDPAGIKLHGVPIDPTAHYRVTVNDFLAGGGDQFFILREGADPLPGLQDREALAAYFEKHHSISPPPTDRITVVAPAH